MSKLQVEYLKPKDLKKYDKNSRTHSDEQVMQLVDSISQFGFVNPILVDERSEIIAGHGRLEAARKARLETVPVIRLLGLDENQKKALRIADNQLPLNAGWNLDVLAEEISLLKDDGFDLDILGFDDDFLDGLLKDMDDTKPLEADEQSDKDNSCPAVDESKSIVQTGDIWILGNHRLMCGDSAMTTDVEKLMNGNKVDMLLTDPPYGVDYSAKNEMLNAFDKGNRVQRPIKNDAIKNYREFFGSFLSIIPMNDYNTCYIAMSSQELHNLRLAFEDAGFYWSDYLIWVKNNHVLGRKDYNAKHEFILYGWKNRHKFYGGFSTTTLEYARPLKSDLHPTMKPVDLWVRLIGDGSDKKALVYDPFSGSGTTFIAAEKTKRKAYGMELDNHYCDVIIKRWQELTGKEACRESDGVKFNDLV